MTESEQEIIAVFEDYMKKCGGAMGDWYVGVSKDARDRLFTEHGLLGQSGDWTYTTAKSSQVARDVEDYFVNQVGTDGGTGGGDETADMVYAYKKAAHTNP